jgi:hypothetical protein
VLGGPALYLVGETLFRARLTGIASAERLAVAALLGALAPVGGALSALALTAVVTALLGALAAWELGTRLGPATDAAGSRVGHLRLQHHQQEGTTP